MKRIVVVGSVATVLVIVALSPLLLGDGEDASSVSASGEQRRDGSPALEEVSEPESLEGEGSVTLEDPPGSQKPDRRPRTPPANAREARAEARDRAKSTMWSVLEMGECVQKPAAELRTFQEDRVGPEGGVDGTLYRVPDSFSFYLCPMRVGRSEAGPRGTPVAALLAAERTSVPVSSFWVGEAAKVPGIKFPET